MHIFLFSAFSIFLLAGIIAMLKAQKQNTQTFAEFHAYIMTLPERCRKMTIKELCEDSMKLHGESYLG